LLAVDVPAGTDGDQRQQHRENLQEALHEHSLPRVGRRATNRLATNNSSPPPGCEWHSLRGLLQGP
jgi:hypothetical protein